MINYLYAGGLNAFILYIDDDPLPSNMYIDFIIIIIIIIKFEYFENCLPLILQSNEMKNSPPQANAQFL